MTSGPDIPWGAPGAGSSPFYSAPGGQGAAAERPPGPRYEQVGTLGRGSMGLVALGWDRWLHRNVALKIPHRDSGISTEQTLRREAQLAARLDHPAIAAIYDISEDNEGRPFFVMRLVRGVPLYKVIDEGERASAIRAVRQATEAMAHAHQQGVVHRDLSPSNILVGELGVASVIDWGFAAEFGDLDAPRRVGTPGYASPEQARGSPPDPRADVWSLGALLRDVAGASPPPDLLAIVEQAMAPEPSERYPDALTMARDLIAWEHGRLVSAHSYSRAELVGRRLWPWRYPLAIGGVALLALLGQGWWDAWTVRQQRDRAIEADKRAVAALGDAFAEQAVAAWRSGDARMAASLARKSLEHGRQPAAMGVLLAEVPPPFDLLETRTLPHDCVSWELTPDGSAAWCARPFGATVVPWGAEHWSLISPQPVEAVRVLGGELAALLVDGTLHRFALRGGTPMEVDARPGTFLHDRQIWRATRHQAGVIDEELPDSPCEDPLLAASRDADGDWWMSCVSGALWRVPIEGATEERRPPGSDPILRLVSSQRATWAATGRGTVVRLDGPAQELSLGEVARQILAVPEQDLLLVRGNVGRVRLLDAVSGRWVSDLPVPGRVAVDRDGHLATLEGRTWSRARLIDPRFVPSWRVPYGLSSATVSPDGTRIVTGDGGGFVRTFGLDGVVLPSAERWQYRVIKGVALGLDGTLAAVAFDEEPVRIWEPSGEPRPVHQDVESALRRVGVWADGTVFGLRYGEGIVHLSPWKKGFSFPGIDFRDLFVDRERNVALLASDSGTFRYGPDGRMELLDPAPSSYVAGHGDPFAYTQRTEVALRGPGLATDLELPVLATAVALARDLLLVGGRDGELRVFSFAGELLAALPAHEDRLSAIVVHPDGRRVITTGWDGRVRLLDLAPLYAQEASWKTPGVHPTEGWASPR